MRKTYSEAFGAKEKVLNYACQTYQLSRPNKVGAVMSLIRECQPDSFEEWESWYFSNAYTAGKVPAKVTEELLDELGDRLYAKITEVVIPEWQEAFRTLSLEDCRRYIRNLTINRTYDGYLREKGVIYNCLSAEFPTVRFEETSAELDHAGDIDYLGHVGGRVFGIQVKPVTSRANFGNYSASERMKDSFRSFFEEYGGNVFVVYSVDDEIANREVIAHIAAEVERLTAS